MKTILITGGGGFIGSHLAEYFSGRYAIVALDTFSRGAGNLAGIPNLELVKGSILDTECVASAMEKTDYVLHQAAQTSVPASVEHPNATIETNVTGTLNVLESALEHKVKKVVLASSCAVYGNAKLPASEGAAPAPFSPYAKSKLRNEKQAAEFAATGLPTACLRYFNIYGPRQAPDSPYSAVIPRFIHTILSGKRITFYGDGKQTRDFVYVRDVARANELAMLSKSAGVFNVCSGKAASLIGLAEMIMELTGKKTEPLFEPERKGDIRHMYGSPELAKKEIGFEAKVSLEEGLKETIDYFIETQQQKQ